MEFGYQAASLPKINLTLGGANEAVRYIDENGQLTNLTSDVTLWKDSDGNPAPFQFYVYEDNTYAASSILYTINWTMKAFATDATVQTAKMDGGKYTGVLAAIHFSCLHGSISGKGLHGPVDGVQYAGCSICIILIHIKLEGSRVTI